MNNKPTITKQEMGERLYFLNQVIKDLKAQKNDELKPEIKELYELKSKVLLKLLTERQLSVRGKARTFQGLYIFRVNRTFVFHIPQNEEIKEAVREYVAGKIERRNSAS